MKAKSEKMKDLRKVRRRKITIQKLTTVKKDKIGNEIREWDDWKTLWVEKNHLWGEEYYAAKTVNEEKALKLTLRYVFFLDEINTTGYRIVYNNKKYDIDNIDHINDDGMWVVIKALEGRNNGKHIN